MPNFNLQAIQKEREEKLVTTLKERLQPFIEGRTDEFEKWATSEASRLSKAGKIFSSALTSECLFLYCTCFYSPTLHWSLPSTLGD